MEQDMLSFPDHLVSLPFLGKLVFEIVLFYFLLRLCLWTADVFMYWSSPAWYSLLRLSTKRGYAKSFLLCFYFLHGRKTYSRYSGKGLSKSSSVCRNICFHAVTFVLVDRSFWNLKQLSLTKNKGLELFSNNRTYGVKKVT
jgi:hypothetical protein